MSKTKISEFSTTPGNNTDINGINIAEGCAPSGINNAIRELMSDLKEWQSGAMDVYVIPQGTAAAPSIQLYGDLDTGLYGFAANQLGVAVGGASAGYFSSAGWNGNVNGTITGDINATTIDTTNLEVTNIKAKDGTAAITIADSTGIVSVSTVLDLTTIEVTNIKAKDGTASASIADSTGVITVTKDVVVNGVTLGKGLGSVLTNTALGRSALAANTAGDLNTAVGNLSLTSNIGGTGNTAVGHVAMTSHQGGSLNTAVGAGSLTSNLNGNNNTAIGQSALGTATGSNNTAVGSAAGSLITNGNKNTIIGNYDGNQGGLDIRTASNYIVLSDGDGNPRAYWNGANATFGGSLTATTITGTQVNSDNLRLDGNTLSSTDTNGNIIIAPNGTGQVQITNAALDLTTIEVTNIKAKDGTASITLADSTGQATFSANPLLNAGTADGVLYLNASKVATSGSALTFDGTNLATSGSIISSTAPAGGSLKRDVTSSYLSVTGGTSPNTNGATILLSGSTYVAANTAFIDAAESVFRSLNGASEYMRLTSTGLGIGTSSPSAALQIQRAVPSFWMAETTSGTLHRVETTVSSAGVVNQNLNWNAGLSTRAFTWSQGGTENMRIDSSGNLGIGTSSPSQKLDVFSGTASSAVAQFTGVNTGRGLKISTALVNSVNDAGVILDAQQASGVLMLATGGTERARITSGGDFRVKGAGTAGTTDAVQFSGSAPASAMTLDASGNLFLGGTGSVFGYKQEITGTSASSPFAGLALYNTSASQGAKIAFLDNANSAAVGNVDGNLVFYAAGRDNERARIDSSGNLLVGTQAATYAAGERLSVSPASGTNAVGISVGNTNNIGIGIYNGYTATGTATALQFQDHNSVVRGSITVTTSATAYNTSSDYRLKHDIAPMTGALAKVAALKPVIYKWKADGSDGEGFIAHELAEVCPSAVVGEKDAVNEDGSIKPQGIDTSFLVATLTAAIQEQQAMINELKAEVAALKGA